MPTQEPPSPPIWVKVRVWALSSMAMKWQPMPAEAKLPSGSWVEVPCGQPAQKAGMRRSRPAGRSGVGGAGGWPTFRPASRSSFDRPPPTISGDSSIVAGNSLAPARSVLPTMSGRLSARML